MTESHKPRVVTITQTRDGFPSQWEGCTDDGRAIYARFRFGGLYVGIGATLAESVSRYIDGDAAGTLYDAMAGDDPWGGVMTTAELMEHTSHVIDWALPTPTAPARTGEED